MARSKVRCPSCSYPITLLESHKDADSIECPNCRGRVHLRAQWQDTVSNDRQAAFTGWNSPSTPHSVYETVHEDAPQYVVEGGVTKRIVRRVFRRIVRRTVRMGGGGQRVQWEVDWSWLTYLIYGVGICLLFAVVVFGPGFNFVRQVATGVNRIANGNDNPFDYLAGNWKALHFVDVAKLEHESLAQSNVLSPAIARARQDPGIAQVIGEVRRIVDAEDDFGFFQAVEFKTAIDSERFGRGKSTTTAHGLTIYRSGSYFYFQPADKLVVRTSTLDGALAALDRAKGASRTRPQIEADEDVVDWVVSASSEGMAAAVKSMPLSGIDAGTLQSYNVLSLRVDFHFASICRLRSVIRMRDATAAASLASRLNEAKSAVKAYHAKQRSFNGMRKDSPEHAALSILEAGDFVASGSDVRCEYSLEAAVLASGCQAMDGGSLNVEQLAKSMGVSSGPTGPAESNRRPTSDSSGDAVASRTAPGNGSDGGRKDTDSKVVAIPAGPPRNQGVRGLEFDHFPTIEEARSRMVEKFGKDRVVTVVVKKLPANYAPAALVDFLTHSSAGDATSMCAVSQGDGLQVAFAPAIDLAALAGQISFGEVEFDLEKRVLTVHVTRGDALPRGKRPTPRPLMFPPKRQRIGEARVDQLLAEVQANQATEAVRRPLTELAEAIAIDSVRSKVCESLLSNLEAGRNRASDAYAAAFANWAETQHIPKLIEFLDSKNSIALPAIFNRMAEFKDERTLVPMARHFELHAAELGPVFENIGDSAESTVMALLENSNPIVAMEAVRVLKVIGTKASLPALEKVATRVPQAAADAREAIGFIQQGD